MEKMEKFDFSFIKGIDSSVESALQKRIAHVCTQKSISITHSAHIQALPLPLLTSLKALSPTAFPLLREVTQLSSITALPVTITSHRRFLGKFIVAGKKLILPLVQALLAPQLRRQE